MSIDNKLQHAALFDEIEDLITRGKFIGAYYTILGAKTILGNLDWLAFIKEYPADFALELLFIGDIS